MFMQEADNVLRIFEEARAAIESGDSGKMKLLSNQTIHSATIAQDPDNIIVAVVVYAISKIIEREHYQTMPGWKDFYSTLIKNWDSSIECLNKNDIPCFRVQVGKIRNSLNKISSDLRIYMKDVFRKAEINKAFKIYEHGLSAEQTAELLGISLWDLSTYIGQSSVSEATLSETLPAKKRVKIAEDIFG